MPGKNRFLIKKLVIDKRSERNTEKKRRGGVDKQAGLFGTGMHV